MVGWWGVGALLEFLRKLYIWKQRLWEENALPRVHREPELTEMGTQGAQYPGIHVPYMGATAPLCLIDCFVLWSLIRHPE